MYLLVKLIERNGEREYTLPHLLQEPTLSEEDIDSYVQTFIAKYYPGGEADGNQHYFMGGSIALSKLSVEILTEEEFIILSKFF